jgi:release factor glutamine methyltransferase
MTIRELLKSAQSRINTDTAALDSELLLCHCLGKERSYLYAWPEKNVDEIIGQQFDAMVERRAHGEPVAYLIGHREFWSLSLSVNNSTLIPRPDTERLVEVALSLVAADAADVLDLGTGTGAIALALAKENPQWQLLGVDIAHDAVALAQKNARDLHIANVCFLQSNWFENISAREFDLIVSNPPYIDAADAHLDDGDVRFEPRTALVAGQNGLADIGAIAQSAQAWLKPRAWLLFEHGYEQAPAVRSLLSEHGYGDISTWCDWDGRERVTGGRAR